MLHPQVAARMWDDRPDRDTILEIGRSPQALLRFLDGEDIERAALVNYVSPDVMGFTAETNDWVARYVRGHEDRLVAFGSVHPRHAADPAGEVSRLRDLGIRAL